MHKVIELFAAKEANVKSEITINEKRTLARRCVSSTSTKFIADIDKA